MSTHARRTCTHESRLRSEATFPRTGISSPLFSSTCSYDLGLCSGLARGERRVPGTGTGRRSGDTAGEGTDFLPREGGGGGARFAVTLISEEDVDWRSGRAERLGGGSSPPTDARVRCAGRSGVKCVGLYGAANGFTTETGAVFSWASCSNLDFRLFMEGVGADSISEVSAMTQSVSNGKSTTVPRQCYLPVVEMRPVRPVGSSGLLGFSLCWDDGRVAAGENGIILQKLTSFGNSERHHYRAVGLQPIYQVGRFHVLLHARSYVQPSNLQSKN